MGKMAMCVVTEELSRAYIGVGSLGTRSEIAAELIRLGGTEEQKQALAAQDRLGRDPADRRLHRARNMWAPTSAVRCAPARRDGDVYRVTGNKTWITHAARTDLMTLLARTNPSRRVIAASPCSSRRNRAAPTTTRSPPRA